LPLCAFSLAPVDNLQHRVATVNSLLRVGFCVICSLCVQKTLTDATSVCNLPSMERRHRVSPTKHLVEEALADRGTTLPDFVARHQADGKNVREMADELRFVTGVPLHWRTLYRWLPDLEEAS
jgi:hypothetical protein